LSRPGPSPHQPPETSRSGGPTFGPPDWVGIGRPGGVHRLGRWFSDALFGHGNRF